MAGWLRCALLVVWCCTGGASARLVGELEPCRAPWFASYKHGSAHAADAPAAAAAECSQAVRSALKQHAVMDWVAGSAEPPVPPPEPLPVVSVMTHREFVLGCHSFESLFSHRMPTYFVFNEEFSAAWGLGGLLRERAPRASQLLVLSRLPGEIIARGVVTALLSAQPAAREPEFLFFSHCDIHQLPRWQPRGLPSYEAAVAELAADFRAEKARRALGRTSVRSDGGYGHVSPDFWRGNASCAALPASARASMPVYAMNTVLVESVPANSSLVGAVVHGVDVGGYVAQGGLIASAHARAAAPDAEPWLSDTGSWLEDHALMYDLRMFRALHRAWALDAAGDVLFHNEYFQPELLCRMGWTSLRTNEVYLHYSTRLEDDRPFARAHRNTELRRRPSNMRRRDGLPVYAAAREGGSGASPPSVYARVDLDWLRAFQLELLYARMSPAARVREHVAANALLRSQHFLEWGNNVFALFGRRTMLPSVLARAPERRAELRELVDAGLGPLFGVAGYEPSGTRAEPLPDQDFLVLRRTSFPLSRYFHVAYAQGVRAESAPPVPRGCRAVSQPFSIGNDVHACVLFLDLATADNRRVAVYGSNFRTLGGAEGWELGAAASAESSSRAPPVLRLPLSARLLAIGSPMVAQPGRSAPAETVLDAAARVCERLGVPALAERLGGGGGGGSWVPHAVQRMRALLTGEPAPPAAAEGYHFPRPADTWYARMRTLKPIDSAADTASFGYPQGVPVASVRTLCEGARVRTTPRGRINAQLCSAMSPAPPDAGPGPDHRRAPQMICCSLQRCHTCDIFSP